MDNQSQPNALKSDQIESGNIIIAKEPDLSPVSNARIGQQNVKPNAVKDTALGPIVTSSHAGLGSGLGAQVSVPIGFSANIVFTLNDAKKRALLAVPDVSVYVPATTLADIKSINLWPTASWGGGTMPVYVMNDWASTDNSNVVTRVLVRNNGASAVPVLVIIRWRIIAQSTNTISQGLVDADISSGISFIAFGGGGAGH